MATNNVHNYANYPANAQLAGIINTVPMPYGPTPTLASGTPAFHDALNSTTVMGGTSANPGFQINAPVIPGSPAALQHQAAQAAAALPAGAPAVAGGGATTPAAGAQPLAPGQVVTVPNAQAGAAAVATGTAATTLPAAGTDAPAPSSTATTVSGDDMAPAPGTPVNASESAPAATAITSDGFGRSDRNAKMDVSVGEATFSFPSYNSTKKKNTAPTIEWGSDWKRVEGNGMYYMQHSNGTKAIPAIEYRINSKPAGKVQSVKVANGWGKKFPDGSIVVFDRNEGPYRLTKSGKKTKLDVGNHTFGGVKVRIFEASVVRTLEPSGAVSVFDSRGNHKAGTPRKTFSAAATGGGSVEQIGKAPTKGGGPASEKDAIAQVQKLTEQARELLDQVKAGTLDSAALMAFQSQLSELPDGIRQAIGASGITPSEQALLGVNGGGAAENTPETTLPVAGRKANADAVAQLRSGDSARLESGTPSGLSGKTVRFGQLPSGVQEAVASAFGSNQGAKAFNADTKLAFAANGAVKLAEDARIYKRRVAKVAGAGPGEDIALTMRPNRQPGGSLRAPDPIKPASSSPAPSANGAAVAGAGANSAPIAPNDLPPTPQANGAPPEGAQPATPPPGAQPAAPPENHEHHAQPTTQPIGHDANIAPAEPANDTAATDAEVAALQADLQAQLDGTGLGTVDADSLPPVSN